MNRLRLGFWSFVFISLLSTDTVKSSTADGREPRVWRVPNLGPAAEAYFSPDSKSLIFDAKLADDESYHVYTINIDGTDRKRINNIGADACTYYFPDGKHLIWTSTRDHLDLPKGDFSDPKNYPQGAELYVSDLDGGNIKRLTNNEQYEAEVTVSPDGKWILFSRQTNGKLDLYRMRPDGSDVFQITHTDDWQEGGAVYMPDSQTIIFRSWKIEDEGKHGLPMTIFTIKHDGTGLKQITTDPGTNWAPSPSPDGQHMAYVRVVDGGNFQIFMMNLETRAIRQLTFEKGFNGFPSFSPDGKYLSFASSRGAAPHERNLYLYLMDISELGIKPIQK